MSKKNQAFVMALNTKRAANKKKMAEGGVASPTKTNTKTGGSNPGGASTGGVGSGLGGAGTGGAATGGASTGGAGTVNVTLSGNSGTGSNSGGGKSKGKGKDSPVNINISNVGGKTGKGSVASGDGPGSPGTGGRGKDSGGSPGGGDPSDIKDLDDTNEPEKYAEGGEVTVRQQKRPMPNNGYNDSKSISKNSGNKALVDSDWTDDPTVRQAQKPSITRLSRPKMAGTDAFSVRDRDDVDRDLDRINSEYPESDRAQPRERYNEVGPNRQGTKVPDMSAQHNNKKAPYTKETENQYSEDMANANMKKVQSPLGRYAKGGPVMQPKDHDMELMEREDEMDMLNRLAPGEHGEQPKRQRDELEADAQNPNPLDMERQHNNGRRPYAKGGEIDDAPQGGIDEVKPDKGYGKIIIMKAEGGEVEEAHESSIAAAIMARRDRLHAEIDSGSHDEDQAALAMAKGGEVDLSLNARELPNAYYNRNENEVLKENYDEEMLKMSQPMDSNEHGDDIEADKNDRVSAIRNKMIKRRVQGLP